MKRTSWSLPDAVDDRASLGVAVLVVLAVAVIPLVGLAWRWGLPRGGVRALGLLPDVVLGLLVGLGLLRWARGRRRPDGLDAAVGSFVMLVVLLLTLGVVADPWGTSVPPSLQLLGARAMAWGPLLLLALRSVRPSRRARTALVEVVLALSVLVAAVGVFEALFPETWEHIGNGVFGMHEVQREVYGVVVPETLVVRTPVAGRSLVRAGSLLFEYLQLGFWLLPGLGIALARVARRPTPVLAGATLLITAGVVASLGRAALVCAVVVYVTVALTRPEAAQRRRLTVAGAVGGLLVAAFALATGFALRLLETIRGVEASTGIHRSATARAWDVVTAHPWGRGLGTGFAASAREGAEASIAENAYLDVALQGGLPALLLFLSLVALLWWALWQHRPWEDLAVGAVAGLVGLTLGGLVLHTWQMLETSWLVYALAGLSVPRAS